MYSILEWLLFFVILGKRKVMKQVGKQLEIPFEKTVSKRLETEEERIIKYVIRKFIQENKSL